jgi:hypothetical protein
MTPAPKATARTSAARKAPARKARATPAAARTAPAVVPDDGGAPAAPAPGAIDLAGGLRSYLASIEAEVRAVSSLSERIDLLVAELNDVREQQAKRLVVLDQLRESVSDKSLGAFLESAIKPRRTRVPEIVPARLQ